MTGVLGGWRFLAKVGGLARAVVIEGQPDAAWAEAYPGTLRACGSRSIYPTHGGRP